jgi:hypothetical protein
MEHRFAQVQGYSIVAGIFFFHLSAGRSPGKPVNQRSVFPAQFDLDPPFGCHTDSLLSLQIFHSEEIK